MDNSREAYLGNVKDMIVFKFQKTIIRLRGSFSLERFAEIKEWDNGYMVVMARYQHNSEPEEEYIDMLPILEKLYINAKEFLEPIKCVSLWSVKVPKYYQNKIFGYYLYLCHFAWLNVCASMRVTEGYQKVNRLSFL